MNDMLAAPREVAAPRARRRDTRSGQALVEFALGAVVLMIFLAGVFEFSRHYYARFSVRHHVSEAARLAATGRSLIDPATGEPMTRAESVVHYIESSVGSAPVELMDVSLDPADGGGPGDIVRISARYRFSFLSSPIVRLWAPSTLVFTVTSVVKNEPRF